jgi:hypothetical protein
MTKVRLLAGMVLFSMACLAQERGTITGTLTDPTGAVVPGVRISIRNLANNAAYQSATTSAGEYTAPNLPAGFLKPMASRGSSRPMSKLAFRKRCASMRLSKSEQRPKRFR